METDDTTMVVTAAQLAEGLARQRRRGEVHRWRYAVVRDLGNGTFLVMRPPASAGIVFGSAAADRPPPQNHSAPLRPASDTAGHAGESPGDPPVVPPLPPEK